MAQRRVDPFRRWATDRRLLAGLLGTGLVVLAAWSAAGAQAPILSGDDVYVETLRPMHILIDPLANDRHPEGAAMILTNVTNPQVGDAVARPDGTVVLTISPTDPLPPGLTTLNFAYTVSDGVHQATGQICVGACVQLPDLPVCHADGPFTTEVGEPLVIRPLDNDVPGPGLMEISAWEQGQLGTVVRDGDTLVYTGSALGTDTFSYWAFVPGSNEPAVAGTVTVEVTAENPTQAVIGVHCIGLSCTFDGRDSTPQPAEVMRYEWDFGDGDTGLGYWVVHRYDLPGSYTVTLRVVPWVGPPGDAVTTFEVEYAEVGFNFTPTCYDRTTSPAACGCAQPYPNFCPHGCDYRCRFDFVGAGDFTGAVVRWSFGNGGPPTPWRPIVGAFPQFTDYAPGHGAPTSGPGVYPVTLELMRPGDVIRSQTNYVEALYLPPQIEVTGTCAERDCDFTASGETGLASLDHWEFGDGATEPATGTTTAHVYPDHRPYDAKLHFQDIWDRPFTASAQVDPGVGFHLDIGSVALDLSRVRRVFFRRPMADPVVVARSVTQRGSDGGEVRVWDVDSTGFSVMVQEPGADRLEPTLAGKETVSYIAVEEGHWELSDGTLIEAHHKRSNTWDHEDGFCGPVNSSSQTWYRNHFHVPFTGTPVVFVEKSPFSTGVIPRYSANRVREITSRWFDCGFERDEAAGGGSTSNAAWIAVSPLPGGAEDSAWRGTDGRDRRAAWGATSAAFTDEWGFLAFARAFDVPPAVVSTLASYLDSDPAHLRQGLVHRTGVELRVEEDLTLDPETEHGPEEITWLALDQGDLLKASPADLAPYPLLIRPDYTRTNRWSAVEILVLENDPDRQHQEDVRVKWPTHPVDTPPQFGNAFCVAPHPTVVGSSVEGFCKKIRYSSGQQLGTDTFSYRAWGRVGEAGPTLVTVEVTEDGPLDLLHEPFQSLAGWVVRHQTSTGTASWSVGEVVAADPPKEGAGSIAAASTACPPTRSDAPLVLQRGDMRPAPGHPDLPRPGTYLVWQGGGGWGDQEIRLKLGSAQERGDIGVMFRYNDSQNFYRVSWDLATGRARIVRRKNGFYTLLAEGTHRLGIGQGVLNPIRISMVGSDIAVGYDHPPDCVPIKAPDPDLVASDPGGFAVGSVALYTSNNAGFFADDVDVTQVFP